jgi:hypothetical protein
VSIIKFKFIDSSNQLQKNRKLFHVTQPNPKKIYHWFRAQNIFDENKSVTGQNVHVEAKSTLEEAMSDRGLALQLL